MQIMISFLLAILSSMLIDNVVLSRFYGICPFLGVSRKVKSSFGMGIAVVFVIVLATVICWPLYNFVLVLYMLCKPLDANMPRFVLNLNIKILKESISKS